MVRVYMYVYMCVQREVKVREKKVKNEKGWGERENKFLLKMSNQVLFTGSILLYCFLL